MTIARSTAALLGTSESAGVQIIPTLSAVGDQVDILADDTSYGTVTLFLIFTLDTVPTTGNIEVKFEEGRVTGQLYQDSAKQWSRHVGGLPAATAQRMLLGSFKAPRFGKVTVTNTSNAVFSGVSVSYVLEKVS